MTSDQPIRHIKISDYLQVDFNLKTERVMYRLTGNVDLNLSNSKQLLLFSIEEYADVSQRYEVKVDLSFLREFNLNDIHPQHDLVQFVGHKDPSENSSMFRALYFRLLRRTSSKAYYEAINIQNDYLA